MHPSHNRPRRKRGKIDNNDDDGLPVHVSRAEDIQSDVYSRRLHPHQQTDSYVPSSSRTSFAISWEGPSSRSDSAADRFHPRSSDAHHRGGRDSHDIHDDDSWSVHPKHDLRHPNPRDWATRDFDQGPPEPQNWGASTSYTDRGRTHGWQPDDRWGSKLDERGANHTHPNNDNRRRNNRKFQRDNGWETRKDRQQHRKQDMQDDPPIKDERSWEPGPGWQARGEPWNKNKNNRNNGNKNKNKKNQNKNRNRMEKERDAGREREQRHDDDDLNKYFAFMF